MNFLLVSAFAPSDKESGANRLRKLRLGLEANRQKCDWLGPAGGFILQGASRKWSASRELVRGTLAWSKANPSGYVVISLPPPWLLLPAFVLALMIPGQLVVDFRDPILNQRINPRSLAYRVVLGFLDSFVTWRAHLVILAAARISGLISSSRLPAVTVLAGLDEAELAATKTGSLKRDPNLVVYGGTFYGSRSPDALLEAIAEESSALRFSFYVNFNDEQEGARAKARAVELGIQDRVEFLSQVPRIQFLDILRGAGAGLIITHAEGSDYAIPGKIYDYLSTGVLPWVISRDQGLLELLKDNQIRASVTAGWTKEELCTGIRELKANLDRPCEAISSLDRLSATGQARVLVEALQKSR